LDIFRAVRSVLNEEKKLSIAALSQTLPERCAFAGSADITTAIVNGRHPPQLNAKKLMRLTVSDISACETDLAA
jgi:hypothetical protein